MKEYYPYGKKEMDFLAQRDPLLGAEIARIGKIERETNPDVFAALVETIIGQQLQGKAAETIKARVAESAGGLNAQAIAALGAEGLRGCGLSQRKADSICDIARGQMAGDIDLDALERLPDEEVIRVLSRLAGVGRWTAEMLLIFALRRPDVVSYTDYGIKNGMMHVYGHSMLHRRYFDKHVRLYSPYGTVASFYLWHISKEKGKAPGLMEDEE